MLEVSKASDVAAACNTILVDSQNGKVSIDMAKAMAGLIGVRLKAAAVQSKVLELSGETQNLDLWGLEMPDKKLKQAQVAATLSKTMLEYRLRAIRVKLAKRELDGNRLKTLALQLDRESEKTLRDYFAIEELLVSLESIL